MNTVSVLFCGDYAPIDRYESLVIEKREAIFGELISVVKETSISIVNIESPLYTGSDRIVKNGPSLRVDPTCINAIKEAGFNIACLANNHIMDYGVNGLLSTIKSCNEGGIITVGAGMNIDEASKPLRINIDGVVVSIIAVAEHEYNIATKNTAGANSIDIMSLISVINEEKTKSDFVIVTLHGGIEYYSYPRPGLKKLCRFLVDQGVAAVMCHHSHVAGAYEIYNRRPIVYGLGNLIFDHRNPPLYWTEGYAARIELNKDDMSCQFQIYPFEQSPTIGGLRLLKDSKRELFISRIEQYRKVTEDEALFEEQWDRYVKNNMNYIITRLLLPFNRGVKRLSKYLNISKYIIPNKRNNAAKLNYILCESHYELLVSSLKKMMNVHSNQ